MRDWARSSLSRAPRAEGASQIAVIVPSTCARMMPVVLRRHWPATGRDGIGLVIEKAVVLAMLASALGTAGASAVGRWGS